MGILYEVDVHLLSVNWLLLTELYFIAKHDSITKSGDELFWQGESWDRMRAREVPVLITAEISHTVPTLWVLLWVSVLLLTAENANLPQMEVKNLIKFDKGLQFQVSTMATLECQ